MQSREMNWVAHASGLRVGLLVSLFQFLPAGRIDVTVRYKPPHVNPTRGAPSYVNDPVYYNYGILSSMGAVE